MSCKGIYSCEICCSSKDIERHHATFKSEIRALAHCKLNYIYLCHKCHVELHRHKGGELDQKIKLVFRNKLERIFLKRYIAYKEIKNMLDISDSATHKLTQDMIRHKEGYERNELIERCIGRNVINT